MKANAISTAALRVRRAVTATVLGWLLLTASLCLAQQESVSDSALFWAIQREGGTSGYLLGTIHSEDPRVLEFSDAFLHRLAECEVFAMEMVPDLPTLSRLTDYMQFQDGGSLEAEIGVERYATVRTLLADYQIPDDWIRRMKVWAAVITLSVPPPETGFFMDFSLSLRAAGAGLEVVGLETLEEQLSFLENMPVAQQLALLDQAIAERDNVAAVHRDMVDQYLHNDLSSLQELSDSQMLSLDEPTREYFVTEGIDARNQRMLESVLPRLQQSRVFIAVGALHLPGENGLLALLRQKGYRLEPLPLPFRDSDL